MRVIELRGSSGLAIKSAKHRLSVNGTAQHDLDGDFTAEPHVPRLGMAFANSHPSVGHSGSALSIERVIEGKYRLDQLIGKGGMSAVYQPADQLHKGVPR